MVCKTQGLVQAGKGLGKLVIELNGASPAPDPASCETPAN